MKFTASTTDLQRTLAKLGGVLPTRSTMPILENILFDLKGNVLTLTGTDMSVWLMASMSVNGVEDGKIAIAYMYTTNKVLGNSTITSTGPYVIPNVKTDVYGVYTNNVPGAAFRGFGAPQALFMAELQMDKLAEKLGMDPVEFRLKNALKDGDTLSVGTPSPSPVSIIQCSEAAKDKFGWKSPSTSVSSHPVRSAPAQGGNLVRGQGFAAGFKNIGFSFGYQENCWAKIELRGKADIDEVILYHAAAEVGQGNHTVMVQMAAEAPGMRGSPTIQCRRR